jgi:hypothetical protein
MPWPRWTHASGTAAPPRVRTRVHHPELERRRHRGPRRACAGRRRRGRGRGSARPPDGTRSGGFERLVERQMQLPQKHESSHTPVRLLALEGEISGVDQQPLQDARSLQSAVDLDRLTTRIELAVRWHGRVSTSRSVRDLRPCGTSRIRDRRRGRHARNPDTHGVGRVWHRRCLRATRSSPWTAHAGAPSPSRARW